MISMPELHAYQSEIECIKYYRQKTKNKKQKVYMMRVHTFIVLKIINFYCNALDVDECSPSPSHSNATCNNTSFVSLVGTCISGYSGDGFQCVGELVYVYSDVHYSLLQHMHACHCIQYNVYIMHDSDNQCLQIQANPYQYSPKS